MKNVRQILEDNRLSVFSCVTDIPFEDTNFNVAMLSQNSKEEIIRKYLNACHIIKQIKEEVGM